MKTAIYIEDGVLQVVLTPEEQFEKDTFRKFHDKNLRIAAFSGSFYDCRGGWVRQTAYADTQGYAYSSSKQEDQSWIVRANVVPPEQPQQVSPLSSLEALPKVAELHAAALAAIESDDLTSRVERRLVKACEAVAAVLNPPEPTF